MSSTLREHASTVKNAADLTAYWKIPCSSVARQSARIHGECGRTYRKAWRRAARVVDAVTRHLLWLLLRRRGVPARDAGARARRWRFVREDARRQMVRGRRSLPRSPIYRGGVVTGAVTTPPGSATLLRLCGLGVATQGHVYAGHKEGHGIFCATHARDLRRREDPAGIGLLPGGSGQGAGP